MLTTLVSKLGEKVAEQLPAKRATLPALAVLLSADVALSLLKGTSVLQLTATLGEAIPVGTVLAVAAVIGLLRTVVAPAVRMALCFLRIHATPAWLSASDHRADERRLLNPEYVRESELEQLALADGNAVLYEYVRARRAAQDADNDAAVDCVLVGGLLLGEWVLPSPTLVSALHAALAARGMPDGAFGTLAVAVALLLVGTRIPALSDDRVYWPDRADRLAEIRTRTRATSAEVDGGGADPIAGPSLPPPAAPIGIPRTGSLDSPRMPRVGPPRARATHALDA